MLPPARPSPDAAPSAAPARRRHRLRRWLLGFLAVFLLLAVLLYLNAGRVVGSIIGYKLRSEIAARLNATLTTGAVTYIPPYGVRIDRATFTAHDPANGDIQLLKIAALEITVAKLPLGTGPLVIQRVRIDQPILHLIHTAAGLAGTTNLVKDTTPSSTDTDTDTNKKLSDLFELRSIQLIDGQLEFEDLAHGSATPIIWPHVQANLGTAPTSHSNYQFHLALSQGTIATATAGGSLDIDSLLLNLQKLSMDVQTAPGTAAAQLPPQLQRLAKRFAVSGNVHLAAAARFPLQDVNHGVFVADLHLQNATCRLPDFHDPFTLADFKLHCSRLPAGSTSTANTLPQGLATGPIDLACRLSQCTIESGQQNLHVTGGETHFNPATGAWTATNIQGAADLGDGPGPIHDANIWTRAHFAVNGTGQLWPNSTFTLHCNLDRTSATLTPNHIPLRQLTAQCTLTPTGLTVSSFVATCCSGEISGLANVSWPHPVLANSPPIAYTGNCTATNVDMRQLGDLFLPTEEARQKLSGIAELRLQFAGQIPRTTPPATTEPAAVPANLVEFPDQSHPASTPNDDDALHRFTARGDLDIRHGHFMEIPVLKDVLKGSGSADAATVGEAAATFDIHDATILFDQAAASAPAVGVQGNGSLTFAGILNMSFIVTPLSDWRAKFQQSNNHFFATIGAAIAGGAQKAFNTAERVALYQCRVTGPVNNPNIEQVPFPALTDRMRPLFQEMAKDNPEGALSQALRNNQSH